MNIYGTYENNRPVEAEEFDDDIHERITEFKENVKTTIYAAIDWITYHPEETVVLASAVAFVWRKLDKYVDIHREVKLRNSMIYDRSLGMYWQTKRPLTANQRLQIETRHKAGESYGQILSDMRILKR